VPSLTKRLFVVAASIGCFSITIASQAAEEQVALCHVGLITSPSFDKHIEYLRGMKRYEPVFQMPGAIQGFSATI
jgi:hypothetical protein